RGSSGQRSEFANQHLCRRLTLLATGAGHQGKRARQTQEQSKGSVLHEFLSEERCIRLRHCTAKPSTNNAELRTLFLCFLSQSWLPILILLWRTMVMLASNFRSGPNGS